MKIREKEWKESIFQMLESEEDCYKEQEIEKQKHWKTGF